MSSFAAMETVRMPPTVLQQEISSLTIKTNNLMKHLFLHL